MYQSSNGTYVHRGTPLKAYGPTGFGNDQFNSKCDPFKISRIKDNGTPAHDIPISKREMPYADVVKIISAHHKGSESVLNYTAEHIPAIRKLIKKLYPNSLVIFWVPDKGQYIRAKSLKV